MPRTKASAIPDTHVLIRLMEEYLEMLRGTEKKVKKVLVLNPRTEKYRDQISEYAAEISMLEIRSTAIVGEIDNLIDKLPKDLEGRLSAVNFRLSTSRLITYSGFPPVAAPARPRAPRL